VSYPIIWLHAGGRWGGPLTTWLMWLFTIVWFSGIIGLIIQNILPRLMLLSVGGETIYDQIDRVARENLKVARRLVRKEASAPLRKFYEEQVRPYLAWRIDPGPASWLWPWRAG